MATSKKDWIYAEDYDEGAWLEWPEPPLIDRGRDHPATPGPTRYARVAARMGGSAVVRFGDEGQVLYYRGVDGGPHVIVKGQPCRRMG